MSATRETVIVMLHESVLASWLRDIGTFGVLVGVVSIGVWLESDVLQWVGGISWAVWLVGKALVRSRNTLRLTPNEAAQYLAERFGARS